MSDLKDFALPILSLAIAAIAVFVGPLISLRINKAQMEANIRLAHKGVVSPIRQAWINELRQILAELTGQCSYYWAAGYEERTDQEYQNITLLIARLKLYINPKEEDHNQLLDYVFQMESELARGDEGGTHSKFWYAHTATVTQAQLILKKEWERVKHEI